MHTHSERPAPFVVGVARSGTTLLRMMLDSHPELAIPPETHFAGHVIEAFDAGGGKERALEVMFGSPRWKDFGISAHELERAPSVASASSPGELLRAFYKAYAARAEKHRWGDKTPPYLDRMAAIQAALPEARFVHVLRDGRDVALSVLPLWFGPDSIEEAASRWVERIEAAREQAAELSGYLELRYEDLVRNPAAELRRVCELLELPWHPAMLDYHLRADERLSELQGDIRWHDGGKIPARARVAIHAMTGRPPSAERIGRWRSEMAASDLAVFERTAGEMLARLGYDRGDDRC